MAKDEATLRGPQIQEARRISISPQVQAALRLVLAVVSGPGAGSRGDLGCIVAI